MTTYTVPSRALLNASTFTAEDPTRPILAYVCGDPSGVLVGTDGAAMLLWRTDAASDTGWLLRVSRALATALKHKRATHVVLVPAERRADVFHGSKDAVSVALAPDDFKADISDFPKWRPIVSATMPKPEEGKLPQLDVKSLGRFALTEATGRSGNPIPTLTSTGNRTAVVVTYATEPDVFGLLMPCSGEPAERVIPAWLTATPKRLDNEL